MYRWKQPILQQSFGSLESGGPNDQSVSEFWGLRKELLPLETLSNLLSLLSKMDSVMTNQPVVLRSRDQWEGCQNHLSPHLSVVIPVHNEKGTVFSVMDELILCSKANCVRLEIILVDDGSSDGTSELLSDLSGPIIVLRNPMRKGSGWSRRVGCKMARGEWLGWIDGDGTYAASDLLELFKLAGKYDQLVGARSVDFGRLPRLRKCVKSLNCQIASILWRRKIKDLNSGLRVFRRTALMDFVSELPDGFSCASTATLAALNRGHHLLEVPVQYRARSEGGVSKFHPVWDTFRLWRVVWKQWMRRHRIETVCREPSQKQEADIALNHYQPEMTPLKSIPE